MHVLVLTIEWHFIWYITAYNWSIPRTIWIQPTFQRLICIKSIVTLSSHLCLGLPRGLFPSAADKNFVPIYRLSFVLHTQLREDNKNYAVLHYAILSNLLIFPPSQVQTLPSVAINVTLKWYKPNFTAIQNCRWTESLRSYVMRKRTEEGSKPNGRREQIR